MKWQDCYAEFNQERGELLLGNSQIEKALAVSGCRIATARITEKTAGRDWTGDSPLWQRCPVLGANEQPSYRFSAEPQELPGMAPHLRAVLEMQGEMGTAWYEFRVFPDIPFVFSQIFAEKTGRVQAEESSGTAASCTGIETAYPAAGGEDVFCGADTLDCVPLGRCHLEAEAILLRDKSDQNDVLLERQTTPVPRNGRLEQEGNIFRITDYFNGDSLLLVKHAPTPSSALYRQGKDLRVERGNYAALTGCGIHFSAMPEGRVPYYASAVGACKTAAVWEKFWQYSEALSQGDPRQSLFLMSNTWGDRSQDMAVCEEFLMKELDRARELHLDIVQIDDGWQKGATANSKGKPGGVWEGYYRDDPDFWQVNPQRFPRGLEPVAARAREYGLELGLWFSPDSSNEFDQVERDIETLWGLYRRYGIRYFKLDGVKIRSKLCEMRFTRLLEELTLRSGGEIRFNLDVTAEDRFGYLYQPQYGTLFVENRYTDWGNYYPHNTFRNLWSLAAVIPARRLQMEFLNNRRNPEKYAGMPFAPKEYGIDYLFATVMPANPLAWMELSRLDQDSAALLEPLTALYRQYAREFFAARVIPIGDCPNGMAFSGYFCQNPDRKTGHLLLFRESTAEESFAFSLPVSLEQVEIRRIFGSAEAKYACCGREIRAEFPTPRSFLWLEIR